jgi:tetratricopeptide (TPR) repeat protein
MPQECTNEKTGRLITLYELNQLRENDRRRFEEHLLECRFCSQELQEMLPLISTMRDSRIEIRQALAGEGMSFAEEKETLLEKSRDRAGQSLIESFFGTIRQLLTDVRRPVVWAPAAVVALILIFLLPWGRAPNPYLPYLDDSKAPYSRVAFRGPAGQINVEAQKAFNAGMAEYLRDNYDLAIQHLKRAVQRAPEESQYWFYLGVSHYLARHSGPAIETLNRALSTTDESLRAKARWYLAQAYLLRGDLKQAQLHLHEIIGVGGEYSARADSLLKQIETIK